jgi:hypothetical protein
MNKPNEPVSSVAENPSRDVRKPADAVPPAADASARRSASPKTPPRPQSDLRAMSKIKILFISANPSGTQRLSLDEEFRGVTEKIRSSKYRDAFEMRCAPAARADDLLFHLNDYRPHIVHFSGHGEAAEGLALLDRDGRPKLVGGDALAQLFATLRDDIRLVVLNACWSKAQAAAIAETIECVIGMRTSILDESAILFAETFYLALGFGRSVQNAFDQARARVMMENARQADIPEIVVRDGVNADATIFAGLETPPESSATSAGPVKRAELLLTLTKLIPAQLTTVKTLVNFPLAYQPGAAAPSAEHAAALVNWAESSGGCGLAAVAAALRQVAPDPR